MTQRNLYTKEEYRKLHIVAHDLFMLCARGSAALKYNDVEKAKEVLSHATRIAATVGIKQNIIRAAKGVNIELVDEV